MLLNTTTRSLIASTTAVIASVNAGLFARAASVVAGSLDHVLKRHVFDARCWRSAMWRRPEQRMIESEVTDHSGLSLSRLLELGACRVPAGSGRYC